jgi:hypothetical protein
MTPGVGSRFYGIGTRAGMDAHRGRSTTKSLPPKVVDGEDVWMAPACGPVRVGRSRCNVHACQTPF